MGFDVQNFTQLPLQPSSVNHTHSLMTSQYSRLSAKHCPYKVSLSEMEDPQSQMMFSKPSHAKEERNGPYSANQGLSTAKPRQKQPCCLYPLGIPTSSCPALICWCSPKDAARSDITSSTSANFN